MAERAILTGLIALVLLTALVKVGPSLQASFERIGELYESAPVDHSEDEQRARDVLSGRPA